MREKSQNKKRNFKYKKKPTSKLHNVHEEYDNLQETKRNTLNPVNALSWYVRDDQILNDNCRLAFNIPTGLPMRRQGGIDQMVYRYGDTYAVPGIAVMAVVPTVGNAKTSNDPVNIAFNGMFSLMRQTNAGKWDFDANDVAMCTLAADSLYSTVRWYTRLYHTLNLNHQSNKYLPQALIEAQGVDFDDLRENANWFRSQINQRIERINALRVPSDLYLFARHEWMFENYYIEGPSEKDQIYCYRPAAYYVYGYDTDGPSHLLCHRFLAGATGTEGRLTARDLIERIDAMLLPIFDDEDMNLIGGYIAKTYEGHLMHLDLIPDYMPIKFQWSDDVLLQFKNAKPMPVRHGASGHQSNSAGYYDGFFDIHQKNNGGHDIRLHLEVETPASAIEMYRNIATGNTAHIEDSDVALYNTRSVLNQWSKPIILTSPRADVTPGEVMINTRLIPTISIEPDEAANYGFKITDIQFASEWPLEFDVYTRIKDVNNAVSLQASTYHNVMVYTLDQTSSVVVATRQLPLLADFKYHPEVATCVRTDSDVVQYVYNPQVTFFELDNYAHVKIEDINMVHEAAIMGMLRVPEIASTTL